MHQMLVHHNSAVNGRTAPERSRLRAAVATVMMVTAFVTAAGAAARGIQVSEDAEQVRITTPELEAAVQKRSYVTGIKGGSFVDRKTGFHDAGYGLDIVDWVMEPGSDLAYRDRLNKELVYEYGNSYHGNTPKRSIEGPQICTKARELYPEVIRGKDFVAVKQRYRYTLAAPGKKAGSLWEQTLVFPAGKRFFLSSDRITAANAGDLFLRLDMPGHIKHQGADTFSEVYLSYKGKIPASEFDKPFPPDAKINYQRERDGAPKRFIRAYHLRDPKTGKDGPWLAGMTLDPTVPSEAWCHERGYVCFIEEFGGRPIKVGEQFSAAFLVGYFDSIDEMNTVYDEYAGYHDLHADAKGWKLLKKPAPEAEDLQEKERVAKHLRWWQDQKFGLLMHWGAYSQWGCIESWPLVEADKWARPDDLKAWTDRGKDIDLFKRDYWTLNRTFNPTRFDPRKWAEAGKAAGMRYVVFTTKHHDVFSMFDTKQTEYGVTGPDCPFHTDPRANVTKQVFDAFRKQGFGIGAYFSKADWHSPDYWSPDAPARTRNPNYDTLANPTKWARFRDFVHNQIRELMTGYGPVDILWLDAGQVRPPAQDLHMDDLARMARSYQPGLIVVDRTVGGEYENYRTPEQEVPEKPLSYPWETCMTMGDQWSYKPNDRYKSTHQLLHLLVDIVAKGGNFLLNVGPRPDGELPPPAVARLKEIGDWMRVNGEAIYGTRPVAPYKSGKVAFTKKGGSVYALYLADENETALPPKITVAGIHPKAGSSVRLLGSSKHLAWRADGDGAVIEVPEAPAQHPPCAHVYAFKLDVE